MHRTLLVALALLVARETPSMACQCVETTAEDVIARRAPLIALGRVVDVRPECSPGGRPELEAVIDVGMAWRGVTSSTLVVRTSPDGAQCGYDFEIGDEMIVVAWTRQGGAWSVGLCGGSVSLKDGDSALLLRALAELPDAESVEPERILGSLESSDEHARDAAWELLSRRPDLWTRAAPMLAAMSLRCDQPELRWEALGALARMGETATLALPALIELAETLPESEGYVALRVLEGLGTQASPAAPALARLLSQRGFEESLSATEGGSTWREQLAWTLEAIGPAAAPAGDALLAGILSGDYDAEAAGALGAMGRGEEAASVLWSAGRIDALSQLGHGAAAYLPQLLKLARWGDWRARWALPRLGVADTEVLTVIAAGMNDDPRDMCTLEVLGRAGAPVLAAAALGSRDPRTRGWALQSLRSLGLDTAPGSLHEMAERAPRVGVVASVYGLTQLPALGSRAATEQDEQGPGSIEATACWGRTSLPAELDGFITRRCAESDGTTGALLESADHASWRLATRVARTDTWSCTPIEAPNLSRAHVLAASGPFVSFLPASGPPRVLDALQRTWGRGLQSDAAEALAGLGAGWFAVLEAGSVVARNASTGSQLILPLPEDVGEPLDIVALPHDLLAVAGMSGAIVVDKVGTALARPEPLPYDAWVDRAVTSGTTLELKVLDHKLPDWLQRDSGFGVWVTYDLTPLLGER